jgi:hypothetical protein
MAKVELLDSLAWATLSEVATIARLSNKLVRENSEHNYPTQKTFIEAIRSTSPPRGRAGPMLELVELEYKRQRPIYWERKHAHDEWELYLSTIRKRAYRINAAYAGVHGRPIYGEPRHRDHAYHMASYEERQKINEEERQRDKGDSCVSIIIHQSCIVSIIKSVNGAEKSQLRVRYIESGRTFTTFLRGVVETFGALLSTLGGRPVLGALAHGKRVDIDYPGRRFTIHADDGSTHTAPWCALRYEKTEDAWREKEVKITVIGRQTDDSANSDDTDVED